MLYIDMSIYLSFNLSIYLSITVSVSIYVSIRLSVYLHPTYDARGAAVAAAAGAEATSI